MHDRKLALLSVILGGCLTELLSNSIFIFIPRGQHVIRISLQKPYDIS